VGPGPTAGHQRVPWEDARAYCAWLGEQTGRAYRLPSEAEWEYACRAGTDTPFHFGPRITTDQANFDGNYTYNGSVKGEYRNQTVPVGSFPPNAFGLYDLHGNVWEWCQDTSTTATKASRATVPPGKAGKNCPAWCAAGPGSTLRGAAVPRPANTSLRAASGFVCVVRPPSNSGSLGPGSLDRCRSEH
jgi:formylglycine-generating enzyme required for sulfatase activity